jgi:hypothetical protein
MEVLTIMQVQIKFTTTGCSAITGNFAPGDLLRTSAEMARHLVDDAKCAEYVVAKPQADGVDTTGKAATTKRTKTKTATPAAQADEEGTAP